MKSNLSSPVGYDSVCNYLAECTSDQKESCRTWVKHITKKFSNLCSRIVITGEDLDRGNTSVDGISADLLQEHLEHIKTVQECSA